MKAIRTFTVRPVLAESLAPLDRLASNWRWSWSRATHALFASMDPDLWEGIGGNPSRMLGALGQDRLDELARDDDFLARVRDEAERLDAYLGGDRWFQQLEGPQADRHRVLLARVRGRRLAPAVFGWPRHPRG